MNKKDYEETVEALVVMYLLLVNPGHLIRAIEEVNMRLADIIRNLLPNSGEPWTEESLVEARATLDKLAALEDEEATPFDPVPPPPEAASDVPPTAVTVPVSGDATAEATVTAPTPPAPEASSEPPTQ